MFKVNTQAAQGDLLVRRVSHSVTGLDAVVSEKGSHVVGHSETGHHHAIADELGLIARYATANPLVDLIVVPKGHEACLVHHRSFDTHPTLSLGGGTWEVRRQREHTPDGWRQVTD